jgi:hypothetical protein
MLLATTPSAAPYAPIANPFLSADSGTDIQRQGDLQNLQIGRIRVNQAGYRLGDVRAGRARFVVVGDGVSAVLVHGSGFDRAVALHSIGKTVTSTFQATAHNDAFTISGGDVRTGYPLQGTAVSGNLSEGFLPPDLPSGTYTIEGLGGASVPFLVSKDIYPMVRDAALMFLGIQRSGDGHSWFHGPSHLWDGWLVDSNAVDSLGNPKYKGALAGGWYDHGDHLKETRSQSYTAALLGAVAATHPSQDFDHLGFRQDSSATDGIPDLLRELKWGCDFAIGAWRLGGGTTLDTSRLFLSVGDFGKDHGCWNRPEVQDTISMAGRGSRRERLVRRELGSESLADWAAGLAFASRLWKPYGSAGWSDTALMVAKSFYELAKKVNRTAPSPSYNGEAIVVDDLALAATALLWATGTNTYFQDLASTPSMPTGMGGACGVSGIANFPASDFLGGFLGCGSSGMRRGQANTDLGSVHTVALEAFHSLVLRNDSVSALFGIAPSDRAALEEKVVHTLIANLAGISIPGRGITLPTSPTANQISGSRLTFDSTWNEMFTRQQWIWNSYLVGDLYDLATYLEVTGDILATATVLPNTPSPAWNRDSVAALLASGAGLLLGVNPWDVSWVVGVGAKNPMHIHHRSANPELRNIDPPYAYRIPVGAVYGGAEAVQGGVYLDDANAYHYTEVSLEGSALLAAVATFLSNDTSTELASGIANRRTEVASSPVRVRHLSGRVVLERPGSEPLDLQILDGSGHVLERRTWKGSRLELPAAAAVRVVIWGRNGEKGSRTIAPF